MNALTFQVWNDMPWVRAWCICHLINLIFGDMLPRQDAAGDVKAGSSPEFTTIIAAVRKVFSVFFHSTLHKRNYDGACAKFAPGERVLQPVFPVVTRWSSFYFMMLSFMMIWNIINRMPAEELGFTSLEWKDLKASIESFRDTIVALVLVFEQFFIASERFSASDLRNGSLLSDVRPEVRRLVTVLDNAVVAAATPEAVAIFNVMRTSTLKRFNRFIGDTQYAPREELDLHAYAAEVRSRIGGYDRACMHAWTQLCVQHRMCPFPAFPPPACAPTAHTRIRIATHCL